MPCSTETSSENTICYHPKDSREEFCPITYIDFVHLDSVEEKDEFVTRTDIDKVIAYSRDRDALPIVDTVSSTVSPCLGSDAESWAAGCKVDERFTTLSPRVDETENAPDSALRFYTQRVTAWALKCERDLSTSKERFLFQRLSN